jgi:hypothetical protein
MIWQDILFAVGGIVFAVALLPAVRDPQKPPLTTSLVTGCWLAAFVPAYATLGLTWAAVTTSISASLWLTLAWQRAREARTP